MSSLNAFNKTYSLSTTSSNATVKQPKELASFSRDIDNKHHLNDSQLKYYYFPDLDLENPSGTDLQSGFADFKENQADDLGQFDGLLASIENYERANQTKVKSDIITWRGLMTSLMTLPYNSFNQKLVYNIVIFDGQLFIQQDFENGKAKKLEELDRLKKDPFAKRLMYTGYKFENMTTLDKPWAQSSRKQIESRNKTQVNNIEQYATVVNVQFGSTKLTLGAEIDCVWDYKPTLEESSSDDPLSHYVELKTTGIIDSPKKYNIFQKKLLRSWAQCFLVGIPKLIYGFRDDQLLLRSIEQFEVEKIPLIMKNNAFEKSQNQSPKNKCMHCLKFFIGLIDWINENVPKDDASRTFRLTFDSDVNKLYLNLTENSKELSQQLLMDSEDGGMLTSSFKKWRNELNSKN